MKHIVHITLSFLILSLAFSMTAAAQQNIDFLKKKRIMLLQSYQKGYYWCDGIESGVRQQLAGTGVLLEVFYMDSKRKNSKKEIANAAREALRAIERFKPDLIIAADDNAQRYVVVPSFKGKSIPVVFCGVNWDATEYGYPASNVTGILELEMVQTLVDNLSPFAAGKRIGMISDDAFSERKTATWYNRLFFNGKMQLWFCNSFASFKQTFLAAQEECDILLFLNNASLADWDNEEAERFLLENITVPLGAVNRNLAQFALLTMIKMPEEQGAWAAKKAIEILGGASPADIPIARNQDCGLIVNLKVAEALGVIIPVSTLKAANIVIGQDAIITDTPDNVHHTPSTHLLPEQ